MPVHWNMKPAFSPFSEIHTVKLLSQLSVLRHLQNMDNQIEISVQSPNTNANTHQADHQRRVNTLHKAALKGDWKAAKSYVSSDQKKNWNIEITKDRNTALHIAVSAKQTAFVRNLVECLKESDLELKNKYGYTAFCTAAASGVVEIAEVMYHKNKNLPKISSKKLESESGFSPLQIAIWFRKKGMAEYLYPITPLEGLVDKEYMDILVEAIRADMYDIALKMLNDSTRIATSTTISTEKALQALAQKDLSYNHKFQGRIWERLVSILATIPCIPYFKRIHSSLQTRRQASKLVMQMTLLDSSILIQETQILHDAAKIGNVEFLTLITQSFPGLTWNLDSKKYTIFHVAVINRQEKVFSLIYQTGAAKDFNTYYSDDDKNNILHLAGKIAPPSRLNIVSGPALQMQIELLWFKEVKKIVRPFYVQAKNKEGKTPRELFTMEHENLRKAGEKWMKDTSTSCMLVAALIATVAFAAAFTVPGGNKGETGSPIFLTDRWFKVFVISDAVAMFSSIASIMMFLSILTSRYGEDEFEFLLPAKLMAGLSTLFASIVCMVLTFSATFFLAYKEEKQGTLPKLVAALAVLPITLYAVLNCRLWIALFRSTCWTSRFMFRPGKHKLF
ncbi:unnamed protein product [Fraxinus pennsylvanica]|uniref:PGG domain-containing protein n=1 Tax=Fraxinus pennsylvanica TaxID=56036 RepID=A0AAD2E397_9LAMI|nr:unnamed protein product [Fraxinus pennsylvanica]